MKVVVGMSGGVDSSVAALLLKEEGHEVTGVSMTIWDREYPASSVKRHACFGPGELEDIKEAKSVCDIIGIPFYSLNCARQYRDIVLAYFREEYLSGRTPNPCIKCNHLIKFGILPDSVKKAKIDFEVFATGHYAKVEYDMNKKRYILKKAKDKKKDQSYFLYRLSQNQFSEVVFPLGNYFKDEVKDIARKKGLPVYDKTESQDFFCGNYNELLNVKQKDGNIVDKDGKVLGKHKGIWNYTLGQRRGLRIFSSRPYYVIKLNKKRNEVVVGFEDDTYSSSLVARDVNWVSIGGLSGEMKVMAKIRSSQAGSDAIIKFIEEDKVYIKFNNSQKSISPGQSVVFYDSDIVVGGGIIHG